MGWTNHMGHTCAHTHSCLTSFHLGANTAKYYFLQTPDSPRALPGADNTGTDYREGTGLSRLLKQKAISHSVRFQGEANSVIFMS